MASQSPAQRARALQEQNEKKDLKGQIQTLTAQIKALQIQLGAAESDRDRAVVSAVAQAERLLIERHEQLRRRTLRDWRAESANATRLLQAKDDTIYGLTGQITACEAQVEELRERVGELENALGNAAPAPADAMAVDGPVLECAICASNSEASKMLSCGGDHHMCSECFGTCLDGKIATGCVAPVTCQGVFTQEIAGECVHEFSDADLVHVVGGEKVLTWFMLKMDVKDEQVAMAQKQLLESVFKTVQSVEEARQYIIGEILTTKCPKPTCGQVFHEFEGCASLICLNANCWVKPVEGVHKKTNFCAWCGKAWGNSDEMHRHIIYCSMNPSPGQYYPNWGMDTYLSVLRKRQRDDIMQYLRAQQESVGLEMIRQILVACQQDISECGIEEIEYNRL